METNSAHGWNSTSTTHGRSDCPKLVRGWPWRAETSPPRRGFSWHSRATSRCAEEESLRVLLAAQRRVPTLETAEKQEMIWTCCWWSCSLRTKAISASQPMHNDSSRTWESIYSQSEFSQPKTSRSRSKTTRRPAMKFSTTRHSSKT